VPALLANGSAPEIAQIVDKQLSNYTYTFPKAPGVSAKHLEELFEV
jgi:hypothetical protein